MKEDKYPIFFFESDYIHVQRKIAQKSQINDESACFYLIRPYSIYVSLCIVKYTNLSGNSISVLMNISSIVSIILVFCSQQIEELFFWGAFSFYFIYFLDVIDGEVARLRSEQSKLGAWLDKFLWYSFPITFYLYINRLVDLLDAPTILPLISLISLCLNFFLLNVDKKDIPNLKKDNTFFVLIKMLLSYYAFYFIFPLVYYFLQGKLVNLPIIYVGIILILYFVFYLYSVVKTYITFKE